MKVKKNIKNYEELSSNIRDLIRSIIKTYKNKNPIWFRWNVTHKQNNRNSFNDNSC